MCGYYSRAATIRCAATIRTNTVVQYHIIEQYASKRAGSPSIMKYLSQSEARKDQVEPQRVMNQAASLKRARV